ncbi:universal stress protein [Actinokineospora xionganensis]|uniref:Universal stress protein n=1 Tax=Actinokineospora xionganensis TaxID=2684470 RepID=A0ABR7LEA5_9PSEU|nr:universal stress protein [Actinokineospora xionganensis]MBC6451045.1 universal stress protein [Actinokineospora xionganensis]
MPQTLPDLRPPILSEHSLPGPSVTGRSRGRGVVVGTDGSYLGDRAVAWAARHADLLGDALHVYQSVGARAGAVAHGVNQVAHEHPTMAVVRHFIDEPDPLDTLVDASAEAGLVVVGARGRHHPGLGLGHLVRPLVGTAQCPVAVVKGHPDAIRGRHATVSVAVSGREDAAPVRWATDIAARTGARLRVVHAAVHASDVVDWAVDLAGGLAPGLAIDIDARSCLPHEIVASVHDTDLLVVGTGAAHPHAGIGPITNEALFHAPCPVVVVRA